VIANIESRNTHQPVIQHVYGKLQNGHANYNVCKPLIDIACDYIYVTQKSKVRLCIISIYYLAEVLIVFI